MPIPVGVDDVAQSTHNAHVAAIRGLLAATDREVFTYAEIEAIKADKRPADYILIDVSRMYGGAEMADGTTGTSMWRVGTLAVSHIDENAYVLLDDCCGVLEDARMDVQGEETGPITFETEYSVQPDNGKYSGRIDWTYDHS